MARKELRPENLRPAAVLIPIVLGEADPQIILTQRSDALRHHAGQISFPGGSMETRDADLAETALRESEEEISLAPEHVRVLGFLPDYPTITGFRVTPVVGIVEEAAQVRPDASEVTAIHYLPLQALMEEGRLKRHIMQREGVQLPVFEIEHADFHVWGATAGMLYALRRLLLGEELSVYWA